MTVRADAADLHLEGRFWLAFVLGPAFPAPAHMAMATDVFEEGWLIVPVHWYTLVDRGRLGYKREDGVTRYIVVNAMIRLGGLRFEGSQGGPQGRKLRNQATNGGLSFLGRDAQNLILAACDDD